MKEPAGVLICALLGAVCALKSILQFKEKGFLFNNAYIWASKKERERMDKRPYYRQSGVVFALCAAMFFVFALECALMTGRLLIATVAIAAAAIVYAIVSGIKLQK